MTPHLLSRLLRDDRGENSIMQVISIAVSAILIVAGLVAAPGLINSARDTNAKGDLVNLAKGMELYRSNTGTYPSQKEQLLDAEVTGAKLVISDGVEAKVLPDSGKPEEWCLTVKSRSGTWLSRGSESTRISEGASQSASLQGSECHVAKPTFSDWSQWKLFRGAYIDGDELVLPTSVAYAVSPMLWSEPFDAAVLSFQVNVPGGGSWRAGSYYWAEDQVTSVTNNGGYKENGITRTVPAGWQPATTGGYRYFGEGGPNVKWTSFWIGGDSTFVVPGSRIKMPSIQFTD